MRLAEARFPTSFLRLPPAPLRPPFTAMSRPLSSPRLSDNEGKPKKEETSVAVRSRSPDFDAEVEAAAPLLRGSMLTAAIAFVAGTGFTLFGYAFYTPRSEQSI